MEELSSESCLENYCSTSPGKRVCDESDVKPVKKIKQELDDIEDLNKESIASVNDKDKESIKEVTDNDLSSIDDRSLSEFLASVDESFFTDDFLNMQSPNVKSTDAKKNEKIRKFVSSDGFEMFVVIDEHTKLTSHIIDGPVGIRGKVISSKKILALEISHFPRVCSCSFISYGLINALAEDANIVKMCTTFPSIVLKKKK